MSAPSRRRSSAVNALLTMLAHSRIRLTPPLVRRTGAAGRDTPSRSFRWSRGKGVRYGRAHDENADEHHGRALVRLPALSRGHPLGLSALKATASFDACQG